MEKKTSRHSNFKFKSWSMHGPRTSAQQSDCEFTDYQLLGFFNHFKYSMNNYYWMHDWFLCLILIWKYSINPITGQQWIFLWNSSLNHSYEFVLYSNVSLSLFEIWRLFYHSVRVNSIWWSGIYRLRSRSYIFVSIFFTFWVVLQDHFTYLITNLKKVAFAVISKRTLLY